MKRTTRVTVFGLLIFAVTLVARADSQDSVRQRKANLDAMNSAGQVVDRRAENAEAIPLVAGTELTSDGGFEVGSSPSGSYAFTVVSGYWTWQPAGLMSTPDPRYYSVSSGTSAAHSGNWCLYFDLGPSMDRLYQTVVIPSGTTATLSFWLKIGTLGGSSLDSLTVSIADTSGVPLSSVTFSDASAISGYTWVKYSYDVSTFAGRTVRLQFGTSVIGQTIFLLDDVSIVASQTIASCVEDAYTMCLVNGRYKVTSHWKNQYAGGAVANLSKAKITDNEGAFWIADANTHEYLIRFNTMTDNGRVWIAIPTFTSVEFWVNVVDTMGSHQSFEYHSPPGNTTLIYDPSLFVYP